MTKPKRVELGNGTSHYAGYFRLDEYPVSFARFDGSMSPVKPLLVFERGDAVAALVYNTTDQEVYLTNQFRLPVHLRERAAGETDGGWIHEVPAGMIRAGEKGPQSMARELAEEIGLNVQIEDIEPLFKFFVSPGGTTEQVALYLVKVRHAVTAATGGLEDEGENIRVERVPIDVLFARADRGEIHDAKTLIAALWLKQHLAKTPASPAKISETVRFPAFAGDTRVIGYKTGDIMSTGETDAWVSPENTDMLMDRFAGKTISATVRWHGARKDPVNPLRIKDDVIQDALKDQLGGLKYVKEGFVIETAPGEITQTKGLFHVAVVDGAFGDGFKTTIATVETSIDNVFKKIESSRKKDRYKSVLIPLLGTGQGQLPAKDVVPVLVSRARHFFKTKPNSRLREIYFIAYTRHDRELLDIALNTPSPPD